MNAYNEPILKRPMSTFPFLSKKTLQLFFILFVTISLNSFGQEQKWTLFAKSIKMTTDDNHYYWFHVMEHQSSHLGQILFLKKRIPPEPNIHLKDKKKIDERI